MSFGDVRVDRNAEWLLERIAATGSVVLRKLGETRSGEMAVHRFVSSPYVSVERSSRQRGRTAQQWAGRRVLAVQDTTEITFAGGTRSDAASGRWPMARYRAFISSGDRRGCRDRGGRRPCRCGDLDARRRQAGRPSQPALEAKESARWLAGCQSAAQTLDAATQLTMVADRESDIYPLFARKPARLDLIVRAAQDRKLADGGSLFEALGSAACLMTTKVRVAPRGPGDKGRIATVELRAGRVRIARPRNGLVEDLPKTIEMTLVEACEVGAPAGKDKLHWRLLTTHKVADAAQAEEIVQLYACAGASSRPSAPSRATGLPSRTARSPRRSACSTSPPWP